MDDLVIDPGTQSQSPDARKTSGLFVFWTTGTNMTSNQSPLLKRLESRITAAKSVGLIWKKERGFRYDPTRWENLPAPLSNRLARVVETARQVQRERAFS
ncbi:MAG: hypothetical protein JNK75_12525 [Betaproteobacteria bacterium]|nr:hypothetical protein [Betaproteobacteria bacterium]